MERGIWTRSTPAGFVFPREDLWPTATGLTVSLGSVPVSPVGNKDGVRVLGDPGNGKRIPSQLINRHDGSTRLVDRFQSGSAFFFDEHDQILPFILAMADTVVPPDVDHSDVMGPGEFACLRGCSMRPPKEPSCLSEAESDCLHS